MSFIILSSCYNGLKPMEMVSVKQLNHAYRRLRQLLDFNSIAQSVKSPARKVGAHAYGKERLIICISLQFMEDLSGREFERFIAENNAAKGFCEAL